MRTILIVMFQAELRELLAQPLIDASLTVIQASDLQQASQFMSPEVGVILTDRLYAEEMRERARQKQIPIVLYLSESYRLQSGLLVSCDFDIVLDKPLPNIVLEQAVLSLAPTDRKGRVLLADDKEDGRELFGGILTYIGLEITCCTNGLEAKNAIQPGLFDVLVTDGNMPEMDGIELVRHVRQAEAELGSQRLPAILLTIPVYFNVILPREPEKATLVALFQTLASLPKY